MNEPSRDGAPEAPFFTQLRAFGGIFWIANWMEVVERFAYYGVRVVLPVFMVAAIENGGPQFDHVQKGQIYSIWALVQSFVPIFSGGFADRYGFKINIAVSTVLKIIGYLVMGYSIFLAESLAGMPLLEARAAGTDVTYEIFFTGAMFLALGTAIFKPGVQGLVAVAMPKKSAAFGWGIFYQMVNIGGFVGPLLAGYLRILDWTYVFLLCSAGISLNFIPLFFFKEPKHEGSHDTRGPLQLIRDAIAGLLEPRLFFFTIAFAGFWLMFFQLFDILPNFVDDWIDTRGVAAALISIFGDAAVPTVNQGNLTQEWVINSNALLISFLAFAIGYATGKVRSLSAIIAGIAVAALAIYSLGVSMNGWWTLLSIALFSLGEMTASPTKMRYLSSIAPPGKQGLYMGYVNFTVGIGWSVGSLIAGEMYQKGGDKIVLARRYLVEHGGIGQAEVDGLGRAAVLPYFEKTMGVDAWQLRELLWNAYEPNSMWLIFTVIGLCSMVAIIVYDRVTSAASARPDHSFNVKGHLWVRVGLIPIILGFAVGTILHPSVAAGFLTFMFTLLFVASFVLRAPESQIKGDGH